MRLLRLGIETRNPDLIAHTIVFSAAKAIDDAKNEGKNGVTPNAKSKAVKRRSARQSKR